MSSSHTIEASIEAVPPPLAMFIAIVITSPGKINSSNCSSTAEAPTGNDAIHCPPVTSSALSSYSAMLPSLSM
jgi:hypothetical protein